MEKLDFVVIARRNRPPRSESNVLVFQFGLERSTSTDEFPVLQASRLPQFEFY